jgi:hypothetical protein
MPLPGFAIPPDGPRLAAASGSRIALHDAATGERLTNLAGLEAGAVRVDENALSCGFALLPVGPRIARAAKGGGIFANAATGSRREADLELWVAILDAGE